MNTFAAKSSSFHSSGNRRITREEVITLRNVSAYKKTLADKVLENIHNCINGMSTLLMTPIESKKKTNSMCKFYGHVIQGPWKGYLPKCADCGCEIQSPDQLRKATPRH